MTEFRNVKGNVLIITEINGQLIASYNLEESFVLEGCWLGIGGEILGPMGPEPDMPPIPSEKPAEEWQEWTGGQCPVALTQYVEVQYSDTSKRKGVANAFRWRRSKMLRDGSDIVAYRLIDPPQPDAAGWIEWTGGNCPVDDDAPVTVVLRSGSELSNAAGAFEWNHCANDDDDGDIIKYKVIQVD